VESQLKRAIKRRCRQNFAKNAGHRQGAAIGTLYELSWMGATRTMRMPGKHFEAAANTVPNRRSGKRVELDEAEHGAKK